MASQCAAAAARVMLDTCITFPELANPRAQVAAYVRAPKPKDATKSVSNVSARDSRRLPLARSSIAAFPFTVRGAPGDKRTGSPGPHSGMRADGTSLKPSAANTPLRRALVAAITANSEAAGWTWIRNELLHHGVAMTDPNKCAAVVNATGTSARRRAIILT